MVSKGLFNRMRGFPEIKQHDVTDCAAACLAAVIKFYGGSLSIARLREMSGTSKQGTTGLGIVKAAREAGLLAEGIRYSEKSEFTDIDMPAVAHVFADGKRPHYVVVYKIIKDQVFMMDPAKGKVKLSLKEFWEMWTGSLITLQYNGKLLREDSEEKSVLKLLIPTVLSLRFQLAGVLIASVIATVLGIIEANYVRYLLDDVMAKRQYSALTTVSLLFVSILAGQIILSYFRSIVLGKIAVKIDKEVMMKYYRHVLRLPVSFFISRKDGEIVSRFMDASRIREAISGLIFSLILDTIMAIVGGILLYSQNRRMFFISVLIVFLYGIAVLVFRKPLREINEQEMERNAELTSYLVETLSGIETVKALNVEERIGNEAEKKFDRLIGSILKSNSLYTALSSFTMSINGIGSIVILWFGTVQVITGKMSTGALFAFSALLAYFLSPVKNLIDLSAELQSALAASKRLGEIIQIKTESFLDEDRKLTPDSLKGDIEIDNITFRYGHSKPVIEGLSLSVMQGQRVAIVGESGSGKTTLAKLIMSFFKPEEGCIRIAGMDTKEIALDILRSKIAYISGDVFLISGTVKENISLGNPDASDDEVINAAKMVHCDEFIEKMPFGYDTVLEENGSNLSSGQRQRLSLARALLMRPDILIMDEATSNLDSVTESAIIKTIEEFKGSVTQIVIAHRLNTIRSCDKIFVMEKGEIIESGTHEELISAEGTYARLYNQ